MNTINNFNKITIWNINYHYETNSIIVCEIKYLHPFNNKPYKVRGIAKCHPDDKFDVNKGKHIAESRAKSKLYQKYASDLIKLRQNISEQITKYIHYKLFELEHINDLINNNGERM